MRVYVCIVEPKTEPSIVLVCVRECVVTTTLEQESSTITDGRLIWSCMLSRPGPTSCLVGVKYVFENQVRHPNSKVYATFEYFM